MDISYPSVKTYLSLLICTTIGRLSLKFSCVDEVNHRQPISIVYVPPIIAPVLTPMPVTRGDGRGDSLSLGSGTESVVTGVSAEQHNHRTPYHTVIISDSETGKCDGRK